MFKNNSYETHLNDFILGSNLVNEIDEISIIQFITLPLQSTERDQVNQDYI